MFFFRLSLSEINPIISSLIATASGVPPFFEISWAFHRNSGSLTDVAIFRIASTDPFSIFTGMSDSASLLLCRNSGPWQ